MTSKKKLLLLKIEIYSVAQFKTKCITVYCSLQNLHLNFFAIPSLFKYPFTLQFSCKVFWHQKMIGLTVSICNQSSIFGLYLRFFLTKFLHTIGLFFVLLVQYNPSYRQVTVKFSQLLTVTESNGALYLPHQVQTSLGFVWSKRVLPCNGNANTACIYFTLIVK